MNKKLIAILMLVLLGGLGGWWYAQHTEHRHHLVQATDAEGKIYWTCPMHPQVHQDHPGNCPICGMKLVEREEGTEASSERKPLYWYDPMKPDVHFDKPGKSPFMDMDLVAKYGDEGSIAHASTVEIDPRMVQRLGMRTATVKRATAAQRLDAVGSIAADETRVTVVEARAPGWVDSLDVHAVGETVRRGQALAQIYSPDLLAAQQELALAHKLKDQTLIDAAESRLKLLGISAASGSQQRVSIVAARSGVITELMARQGAQVTPGTPLMRIADLSKVWVIVEVPDSQASWVAKGKQAQAHLRSVPGKAFAGVVDYVDPILDATTRTARARIAIDNPNGELKPGMYADVSVLGDAKQDVTLVPSEAVIRTGTRNVVLVAEAEGRYRPVEVTLGPDQGDDTVVLSGLEADQQVVVSGQFLIDSEASLRGAYERMNGAPQ